MGGAKVSAALWAELKLVPHYSGAVAWLSERAVSCSGDSQYCCGDLVACSGDLQYCCGDLVACSGDLACSGEWRLSLQW